MANDPAAVRTAYFDFNSVDYTPWTESFDIGVEAAAVDFQDLSTGWTRRDVGIKSGSLSFSTFENDDGDVAAQTFALVGDGTAYAFEGRISSGAVAVGNPKYTGSAHLTSWGLSVSASNGSRHTHGTAVDGAITKATA